MKQTQITFLPISKENFNAYESDIEMCSEIYNMDNVTEVNKIVEVIDGIPQVDYPLYSVKQNGKHILLLDRSVFQLDTIEQVLQYCKVSIETESIESIIM